MIKKNNYYYIIYRIAFGLMFFQALNPSKGFACKPFKVKSEHPKTHEVLVGNAAPISEFIFVTNDHNLPDAVKIVELSRGNQTVQGTVVYRRFNKDLAFIKVTDPLKDYCLLNSAEQKNETIRSSSLADFSGFDQLFEDEVKSFVHIVSYNSLGLEVPGIKNAIELLPHISTQFVLRESLSGSIISKNNQLLGIVSQATPQGSLLAIPAFDIQKTLADYLNEKELKQNYQYSYDTKNFQFFGLMAKRDESESVFYQGGNPHEGTNRKQFIPLKNNFEKNRFVNGFEKTPQGVYAELSNIDILKKHQPILAQMLSANDSTTVLIQSIDGIEITGILHLLRVLESCGSCVIDNFFVQIHKHNDIENKYLKSMTALSYLRELLIRNSTNENTMLEALDDVNRALIKVYREYDVFGVVSSRSTDHLSKKMTQLEILLFKNYLTEREIQLMKTLWDLLIF
ncbi:MAG TPA: hypothetical protein PLJ21_05205 [Pseudobdellovibrionaceae bacterium]|nr:hypothetical protein [Pseudobdellovibrionaceae bacterium]